MALARKMAIVWLPFMFLILTVSIISLIRDTQVAVAFSVSKTALFGSRSPTNNNYKNQRRHDDDGSVAVVGCREEERTVVLLYHKPSNVVTTHAVDDPCGRCNVYDDIYSMKGYIANRWCPSTDSASATAAVISADDDNKDRRHHHPTTGSLQQHSPPSAFRQVTGIRSKLHAVGRLDADTTGLLLLTNDGGLVHHVTNAKAAAASNTNDNASRQPISKTYEAVIMGYHDENSPILKQMAEVGVDIGAKYGGMTRPVEHVQVLSHPTPKTTIVSLTVVEGKNRQIRRMFHALGSGVMKLKRTRIGGTLTLDNLEEGQWRILSDQEVVESLHWKPRVLLSPLNNNRITRRSPQNKESVLKATTGPVRHRRRHTTIKQSIQQQRRPNRRRRK